MNANQDGKDPYRLCVRDRCEHELVQGVLVSDLLARDGPYDQARTRPPRDRPRRHPIVRAA